MVYTEKFLKHIFNNMSNNDTETGIIVASLSKSDPDYYYHWTRDSALTILLFVRLLGNPNYSKYYNIFRSFIQSYIDNEVSITKKLELREFGEPKFYVDRTKFNLPWGRPQNDGPAIRSYTLAEYCLHLLDIGEDYLLKSMINKTRTGIIDRDLEFLLTYAVNSVSFDLWEEICGYHYFTTLFQIKALNIIERLIIKLNPVDYRIAKINIARIKYYKILEKFYDHNTKTIKASYHITNHIEDHREWLDSSIILASIYCKENPLCIYQLNTIIEIVKRNITKYGLYNNILPIGRYSEDIYYDGHPWFLTTIALAHYLKKCHNHIIGQIPNNEFLEQLRILLGLLKLDTDNIFMSINQYCKNMEDFIQNFYEKNGELSEQFNFKNKPISAKHLTWSYTSYLLYKNTGFKPYVNS
jgi:glucoamylase